MDDRSIRSIFAESEAEVARMLQVERRKLEARVATWIKEVEEQRDSFISSFEQAAAVFGDEGSGNRPATKPRKRRRSKNRKGGGTTSEEAEKRRRAVRRFMEEQARPFTALEIAGALRLPEFSTKSALRRLIKEGVVVRTGAGSGTRYQLRAQGSRREERSTAQGLIVTTIEDRGTASPRELSQALGAPEEAVERECSSLILEGIVRMTQRNGIPVYAMQVAA